MKSNVHFVHQTFCHKAAQWGHQQETVKEDSVLMFAQTGKRPNLCVFVFILYLVW